MLFIYDEYVLWNFLREIPKWFLSVYFYFIQIIIDYKVTSYLMKKDITALIEMFNAWKSAKTE